MNNNTHLVLDETKLKSGKLNASGVAAVNALANVVQSQIVRYDFGFNIIQEVNCDIPFLICSEGKSMLPVKQLFCFYLIFVLIVLILRAIFM